MMQYTEKLFDQRNNEKKLIHHYANTEDFYVNERGIWYIKLGINVGCEQNGKRDFRRPVLVLKKVGILFLVLPLTSKEKDSRYYYEFASPISNKQSWGILSQIRVIDKRRFMDKIDTVLEEDFLSIKKRLVNLYDL